MTAFTANRKELAAALKVATVPVAAGHLPVLAGLHIDAIAGGDGAPGRLSITGTTLDLTVATDIEAEVTTAGPVVLPGRLLGAMVDKAASDTVSIDVAGGEASYRAGRTVATLRTLKLEDWPNLATADGQTFELSASDVERLAHTLHAVETDNKKLASRPALGGVHFVDNRAEATDSYRLGMASLGVTGMPSTVVPGEVVARVVKACRAGLTVTFDSRSVTFDDPEGRITWTSRLIPQEFVNAMAVVREESPHELTVARLPLLDALSRVRLLADGDETHPVDFHRESDVLRLAANRQDVGEISDELGCGGDWTERLRFHDRYLADFLTNLDGDIVSFEIESALKPIIARSEDRQLLLLLMPVRIGSGG